MKSFRKQYLECKETGICIEIDLIKIKIDLGLPSIPHREFKNIKEYKSNKMNVCLRYKKNCISSVCKKERGVE